MMLADTVKLTDLITFLLYINNFTDPVKKLVSFTEQFQNGYSGFERFLESCRSRRILRTDRMRYP